MDCNYYSDYCNRRHDSRDGGLVLIGGLNVEGFGGINRDGSFYRFLFVLACLLHNGGLRWLS